ncbi:MAG: hypothetical protein COB38_08915 [Gammaproteobacteria bacterium]|nr:MAG: hypothetical protein COB38_08915 [Gammaproteobacteria bacterium]
MIQSLKTKLALAVALIVIISVVTSNLLSNAMLADAYNKEIEKRHVNFGSAIASNVELFMQKSWVIAQQMANSPSIYQLDPIAQAKISAETKQRNKFIDLIFIQDETGMQVARSNGNLGDRSGRWWYKKIITERKPFISKSYYSLAGNIAVTSAFIPINNSNDELISILGIDIKLGALQEIVERFSSENAYSYVIDGKGTVVAHPDKSQVSQLVNYISQEKTVLSKDSQNRVKLDNKGNQITEKKTFKLSKMLSKITRDALSGKSGFMEYDNINESTVYSHYRPIKIPGVSDQWAVITVEKKYDALAFRDETALVTNIFAGVAILVIVITVFFIATQLVSRINRIANSLKEIAEGDGDLTTRVSINGKDEVEQLGINFNTFLDKLQKIIAELKVSSSVVATNSADIANTSKLISSQLEEQTSQFVFVANATKRMSSSSDSIKISLNQGIDHIQLTNEKIKDGNEQLNNTITEMTHIDNKVTYLNTEINKLAKSSTAIAGVTSVINEIASQTNLLALNAAIEAARAGETGRGFAVVADEVRNLAERTQQSILEIDEIVGNLQQETKTVSLGMEEALTQVGEGVKKINDTKGSFDQLVSTINDLSSVNYEIKDAIEEQANSITSINQNAHDISHSIEESANSLKQTTQTTMSLGEQANELKKITDQFKV